jgi:hypothetical protein
MNWLSYEQLLGFENDYVLKEEFVEQQLTERERFYADR